MRTVIRKVILALIAVVAFCGLQEGFGSKKVMAEVGGEEYISSDSDVIIEKNEKYWFNITEAGSLTISSSENIASVPRVSFRQYDEKTGETKDVLTSSKYLVELYVDKPKTFRIGPGLYYVANPSSYKLIHIKMEFQTESEENYEREWNNSFDTAQSITLNSLYTASTLPAVEDKYVDLDYYRFTLDSQGSVDFYLRKSDINYFADMELYKESADENVTLLDTTSISKELRISTSKRYRLESGNYYLKYIPYHNYYYTKPNSQIEYQFKVNYTPESSSEFESENNNQIDKANLIKTNTSYTGNLENTADIDFYTFSISSSSTVNFQFHQPRETKEKTYQIELLQENSDGTMVSKDILSTNSNPENYSKELILKKGKYYIKVTAKEDTNNSYWDNTPKFTYADKELSMIDYKIKVNEKPTVLVQTVKLSAAKSTLFTGESISLKTKVGPSKALNKKLKWSSADSDIAKVDKNGKVTAIASGECYIIATATDGSGISTKYRIVVKKNTNKKLSSMKSSTGFLSPKFSPDTINYILDIGSKAQTTITLKAENKNATIYIDNKKTTKTTVKLNAGARKMLKIDVVAENGGEKSYTLTVKRR